VLSKYRFACEYEPCITVLLVIVKMSASNRPLVEKRKNVDIRYLQICTPALRIYDPRNTFSPARKVQTLSYTSQKENLHTNSEMMLQPTLKKSKQDLENFEKDKLTAQMKSLRV